jgi:hypothetical protein
MFTTGFDYHIQYSLPPIKIKLIIKMKDYEKEIHL